LGNSPRDQGKINIAQCLRALQRGWTSKKWVQLRFKGCERSNRLNAPRNINRLKGGLSEGNSDERYLNREMKRGCCCRASMALKTVYKMKTTRIEMNAVTWEPFFLSDGINVIPGNDILKDPVEIIEDLCKTTTMKEQLTGTL
jgi:hypothetical protein